MSHYEYFQDFSLPYSFEALACHVDLSASAQEFLQLLAAKLGREDPRRVDLDQGGPVEAAQVQHEGCEPAAALSCETVGRYLEDRFRVGTRWVKSLLREVDLLDKAHWPQKGWLAAQDLKVSYHAEETRLFGVCPY